MMSSNNIKKRRVDVGGSDAPPSLPTEGENNGAVHDELKMISSHMTNMMQMMSSMKGEIIRLTEKCDRMERSIDTKLSKMQIIMQPIRLNEQSMQYRLHKIQSLKIQTPDLMTWITNKSTMKYY